MSAAGHNIVATVLRGMPRDVPRRRAAGAESARRDRVRQRRRGDERSGLRPGAGCAGIIGNVDLRSASRRQGMLEQHDRRPATAASEASATARPGTGSEPRSSHLLLRRPKGSTRPQFPRRVSPGSPRSASPSTPGCFIRSWAMSSIWRAPSRRRRSCSTMSAARSRSAPTPASARRRLPEWRDGDPRGRQLPQHLREARRARR